MRTLIERIAPNGHLAMILILVALLFTKYCKGQCDEGTINPEGWSTYFDHSDYHCYKVVSTSGTVVNFDTNSDGFVNTLDLMVILSHYEQNGQVKTLELSGLLAQYGQEIPNQINSPNLCLFEIHNVQSSGVTLIIPEEYESEIFVDRPGIYFPNATDDGILNYTQSDEGPTWPQCLSDQYLCLETFKIVMFVSTEEGQPFPNVEEYYFLKR